MESRLKVLDLFSGIGGFSLGLERTGGFQTVAFCEIEPYCRAVLRKHWPDVPIFEDVTNLGMANVGPVDVICGGFPCQDISVAGKQAGIDGERSGLWSEFARLIGEIRPRFAIVENVSALLHNGLGRVLGDLAAVGFDAEWHCIPASAVGAPHRRDRIWIVAHSQRERGRPKQVGQRRGCDTAKLGHDGAQEYVAHTQSERPNGSRGGEAISNANVKGLSDGRQTRIPPCPSQEVWAMALAESQRRCHSWWAVEPDVGRVADGAPSRVDRLKALGNAVVPQVVEIIGYAILEQIHDRPAT